MLTVLRNMISTKVLNHASCIERRPSVEDDFQWKTTFRGRRPSVEDNIWWKMTFGGRRPSVEDIGSLHAANSALRHFILLRATIGALLYVSHR